MTTISAVIITWNSADEISACLAAVRAAGATQLIVVDNGSHDETVSLVRSHPDVLLVDCPENRGFAGGVNTGVAHATGDYILILNPDCHVQNGLAAMAATAGAGAASGVMTDRNGQLQRGFAVRRLPSPLFLSLEVLGLNRLFPSNPVNRHYRCLDFDPTREQPVEQPPGAFFLVNRQAFLAVGGMDEQFWPVWFEDVDLCHRLLSAGYTIRFTPAARATHRGAASIAKIYWPFKELAWYGSLLRYATKHFGWLSRRLVGLAVAAASVLRSLTGIFSRHKGVRSLRVYADVFRLALESLVLGRVNHRRFGRQMEGAEHLENA
jgi:N-acetylglucosaminyl-diphospho-decaprenol L-rhamnosyltransferase